MPTIDPEILAALKLADDTLAWISSDAAPGWNYLCDAARNARPQIVKAIALAENSHV